MRQSEAKIDNLHFHDLRHRFASWFVMRRGALQALKEILGHADLKMTLQYTHLAPDHLRNEIEKTERPTQTVAGITHDITHEPVTREALSPKVVGAEAGTRTPTPLRALDPEAGAGAR